MKDYLNFLYIITFKNPGTILILIFLIPALFETFVKGNPIALGVPATLYLGSVFCASVIYAGKRGEINKLNNPPKNNLFVMRNKKQ